MVDAQLSLVIFCAAVSGFMLRPVVGFFIGSTTRPAKQLGGVYYLLLVLGALLGMLVWSALLLGLAKLLGILPLRTNGLAFAIAFAVGALVGRLWSKRHGATA